MQHDLFHIYTVDQHTLGVVKYLRRLSHSSYAHEYPLCSQIMNDIEKPWRLTLAGLFHDIAKGRGGSHLSLAPRKSKLLPPTSESIRKTLITWSFWWRSTS